MANTTEIRKGHEIDEVCLENYLFANLEGFQGPLKISQFSFGQSNPTFLLNTTNQTYVLRKKPSGKLIPTAHMIEREYRILSALNQTNFPIPKPLLFCESPEIIGTPFYIMEFIQGRIFTDPQLPDLNPSERFACYQSAMETLAQLHALKFDSLGLRTFGKPENNFYERQINRLEKTSIVQELGGKVSRLPHLHEVVEWFQLNLPNNCITIVHGDYKIDNLVFHPTESRVIAVLDWELSTLGNPLSDIANFCIAHQLEESPVFPGLKDVVKDTSYGIPTQEQCHQFYQKAAKRTIVQSEWHFASAFSFFKMAVIAQGISARIVRGQASSAVAHLYAGLAEPMASKAWEIITAHSIDVQPRSRL